MKGKTSSSIDILKYGFFAIVGTAFADLLGSAHCSSSTVPAVDFSNKNPLGDGEVGLTVKITKHLNQDITK